MADQPRPLAVSIRVDGEWVSLEGLAPAGDRIALVHDSDETIVLATRVDGTWTTTMPDPLETRWRRAFGDLLHALADMCDAVRALDDASPHPAQRPRRPPRAIHPTRTRDPRQVNRYRGGHRA